jgi:uncharacterized short protein YbdD (DUF466 family)
MVKLIRSGFKNFWWWFRQVTGDAAYENYLRRSAKRAARQAKCDGKCEHAAKGVATPEEFYLERVQRKYTGISTCC